MKKDGHLPVYGPGPVIGSVMSAGGVLCAVFAGLIFNSYTRHAKLEETL